MNKIIELNKPIKLDVGCGRNKREGYVGIDWKDFGQEIIWDITKGIPLPDNSCSHIFCSHVIEHIDDLISLMNEFWRVLNITGELWIICPHRTAPSAYVIQHVRRIDEDTIKSFDYSDRKDRCWEDDYDIKPWKVNDLVVNERPDIHAKLSPRKVEVKK